MLSGQVQVRTVTFLFTDIEGSTGLWEAHPEAMRGALSRHDAIVRSAIESAGGRVFKTMGDAFYAVFDLPDAAVRAAVDIQLGMAAEGWPNETPIRTRVAIHSGEVESRDGDFFGPAANRVSRLLGTGHGGQSLISGVAMELIRDGFEFKFLGEHRLKDLGNAEPIYQICHPDLPDTFPRLRTVESAVRFNNIPQPVTSFVGRDAELADTRKLLERVRLLTLTGSGGTGKTRLSRQLALESLEDWTNGVLVVELAPLTDADLIPSTVASLLGIKEQSGATADEAVVANLRNKQMLLVLDNCEHVLEAAAKLVAAILRNCPEVHILATSRQPLGTSGETVYRVPSLSMPDPARPHTLESVSRFESVRLFVDRAGQAKTDFAVTDESATALAIICNRLDGIPLAVELAAARVRSLSLEEINGRLDQRFQLLTGGSRTALPRQQTLRSLIDWSYDLLDEDERALLRRLSVFLGGWTLESAEALLGDETGEWMTLDLLSSLCDKSLVQTEEQGGATRYRLLESVRQYAKDRIAEAGDAEHWRDRHLEVFARIAITASSEMQGSKQQLWMERLEADHDNLRAALDWSLLDASRVEKGLEMATALWRFWYVRGHLREARDRINRLLAAAPGAEKALRANALNAAGNMAYQLADYSGSEELYRESLELRREMGDRARISDSLNNLANLYYEKGDFLATRSLHEEALNIRISLGDLTAIATSLNNLGNVAFELGEYETSRILQEQSLERCRSLGHTVGIARSLINVGNVYYELGDFARARDLQQESLRIRVELKEAVGIANCIERLASDFAALGDVSRAATLWGAEERLREEMGLARPPNEAGRYDRQVAAARSGYAGFGEAWEQGRGLSEDEAIALALRD